MKRPAIMLYKGEWKRDPCLSMCSPATRGIWIDWICDMDDMELATVTGTLAQLARTARASEEETLAAINELGSTGAATVSQGDGRYAITNRRKERELALSIVRKEVGRTGGISTQAKLQANDEANAQANSKHFVEYEIENEVVLNVYGFGLDTSADLIYGAYPRKVGRGAAIEKIKRAIQKIAEGECGQRMSLGDAAKFLHEIVAIYARSPAGNAGEYTPHPATWFNQSRYMDDAKDWNRERNNGGSNGNGTRHGKTGGNLDALAEAERFARERNQETPNEVRRAPTGPSINGHATRLLGGSEPVSTSRH